MNETDQEVERRINEMVDTVRIVHERLREKFGDFDMKDILLQYSMKDVPSDCVFPLDFIYEKK
jgi:hypothetical protein